MSSHVCRWSATLSIHARYSAQLTRCPHKHRTGSSSISVRNVKKKILETLGRNDRMVSRPRRFGISNRGNTCATLAALQAVLRTPGFYEAARPVVRTILDELVTTSAEKNAGVAILSSHHRALLRQEFNYNPSSIQDATDVLDWFLSSPDRRGSEELVAGIQLDVSTIVAAIRRGFFVQLADTSRFPPTSCLHYSAANDLRQKIASFEFQLSADTFAHRMLQRSVACCATRLEPDHVARDSSSQPMDVSRLDALIVDSEQAWKRMRSIYTDLLEFYTATDASRNPWLYDIVLHKREFSAILSGVLLRRTGSDVHYMYMNLDGVQDNNNDSSDNEEEEEEENFTIRRATLYDDDRIERYKNITSTQLGTFFQEANLSIAAFLYVSTPSMPADIRSSSSNAGAHAL